MASRSQPTVPSPPQTKIRYSRRLRKKCSLGKKAIFNTEDGQEMSSQWVFVPWCRTSIWQVVHLARVQQVLEFPQHSAKKQATPWEDGVVSRNHLNPTGQNRVPFALLSSTFWVDKHKQRVGVRNWNNLTVICVWWHTATARRKVSLYIWV